MSSGFLTRPSTCLRCQLREVILQTRVSPRISPIHFHQRCRPFATRRPLREEATGSLIRKVDRNDHIRSKGGQIRVDASGERYVGKGKRRQKVVVESLPTKFLGTTQADSGVIVMRDVQEEEPKKASAKVLTFRGPVDEGEMATTPLSAQEIEIEVKGKNVIPEQADVNASIEALRVEATATTTVVDKKTFRALTKKLTDSYSAGQLAKYLVRFLRSSKSIGEKEKSVNVKTKLQELAASQWRPGTTPMSQRASGVSKKTLSNKTQYADQILRLCWWMTIEPEEQVVGEIEVHLQPWQMLFLFDLERDNGRPYVEELVDSQTLLDVSTIASHRPASIMRITARRKDAEEIIRRINLALLLVQRVEWDVTALLPTPSKDISSYFRTEDILHISRLTKSAIIIGDNGTVTIHGTRRWGDILTPRRLLLCLLPSNIKSTNKVSTAVDHAIYLHSHVKREQAIIALPVGLAETGLHRRHTGLELVRRVRPSKSVAIYGESVIPEALTNNLNAAAVTVARDLDNVTRTVPEYEVSSDSYWRPSSEIVQPQWKADFCSLVQEDCSTLERNSSETAETMQAPPFRHAQHIVQSIVPGTGAALSYFTPATRPHPRLNATSSQRGFDHLPYINAHFIPSVPKFSSDSARLPTLTLRFHFQPPSRSSSDRDKDLILTGMIANLSSETLSVPLPLFATDVQFTRKTFLKAYIRPAMQDKAVAHFVHRVQKSARAGVGALTAPSELTVRLPRWVAEGKDPLSRDESKGSDQISKDRRKLDRSKAEKMGDVPITYLFTRFEQVQSLQFSPLPRGARNNIIDSDVTSLTRTLLDNEMGVEYREVEGGAIYGNGTCLSLRTRRTKSDGEKSREQAAVNMLVKTNNEEVNQARGSVSLAEQIRALGAENDSETSDAIDGRSSQPSALPLVTAAFKMAKVLTRACAGSLKPMEYLKEVEEAEETDTTEKE